MLESGWADLWVLVKAYLFVWQSTNWWLMWNDLSWDYWINFTCLILQQASVGIFLGYCRAPREKEKCLRSYSNLYSCQTCSFPMGNLCDQGQSQFWGWGHTDKGHGHREVVNSGHKCNWSIYHSLDMNVPTHYTYAYTCKIKGMITTEEKYCFIQGNITLPVCSPYLPTVVFQTCSVVPLMCG